MNIEHMALNVAEPSKMAEWYGRHLGMKVVRRPPGDTQTHFIADESGRVILEIYRHPTAAIPNYAAMDPFMLHIAFSTADVKEVREKLLAAGGASAGDVTVTPAGDVMTFVRDPWGVTVQLVKRATALV